jgi:hypothetical protein
MKYKNAKLISSKILNYTTHNGQSDCDCDCACQD